MKYFKLYRTRIQDDPAALVPTINRVFHGQHTIANGLVGTGRIGPLSFSNYAA